MAVDIAVLKTLQRKQTFKHADAGAMAEKIVVLQNRFLL